MNKVSSEVNPWVTESIGKDLKEQIIRLNIQIGDKTFTRDFFPDVNIDFEQLEEQLQEMPSIFAFWSAVLAEQKTQVNTIERMLKRRRAVATQRILDKALEDRRKLTDKQVEKIIEKDEGVTKIEMKLMLERRAESKLYGIVESLKMKSEHLRSLAGFKRQELRDAGGA